ncbi:unnamed protein product [Cyprideis torosa]|uniref:Uncharacterized protein n=1 Tax=Cyprideis torosa TaxID=163714 RepID=A0A7R8W5N8_9CRUS|nr:unnamed protein product [Cyprideis torosa]CAG0885515.1 unnamed protein product [Cyprideis torosa]
MSEKKLSEVPVCDYFKAEVGAGSNSEAFDSVAFASPMERTPTTTVESIPSIQHGDDSLHVTGAYEMDSSATWNQIQPLVPEKREMWSAPALSPESFFDTVFTSSETDVSGTNLENLEATSTAWIFPEHMINILKQIASRTIVPDKELITTPRCLIEQPLLDPMAKVVQTHLGDDAMKRRMSMCPNHAQVTRDDRGLIQLIQRNCYHAAINLTSDLLSMYGQGFSSDSQVMHCKHTQHSLQLWFVRISLLMQLRMFSVAEKELEGFMNFERPDLTQQWSPDLHRGRSGTLVPFSLRLLAAKLPAYNGNYVASLNRLHGVLAVVEQIVSNLRNDFKEDGSGKSEYDHEVHQGALLFWIIRLLKTKLTIVHVARMCFDYDNAVSILESLIKNPDFYDTRCELQSLLTRLHLDTGNVQEAIRCLEQSRLSEVPCNIGSSIESLQFLMDSALLAVAQNNFVEAHTILQKARNLYPKSPMVVNNLAVILIYLGQLGTATSNLEDSMHVNHETFLRDIAVFNLTSMYDLGSNHSTAKKRRLLDFVSQMKGDAFRLSSLKLPV